MQAAEPVTLVSVIIPVYNRENWLRAAAMSVIDQSCGHDQVQLVLVDDGSSDGSGAICDQLATEYPDVVTTLHQENQGVAAAFNLGLSAVRGEVVGFLGSDDELSANTIAKVKRFFVQHWDQVDLAAIKIEMTGSAEGPHWNNKDRFRKSRVIDVSVEWNRPQLSGGGSFIKTSMFTEVGLRFDPELFMSEDATLNTQVILRRMAYGVIAGPTYYNRRYSEGSASLVSSSHYRPEFYDVILEHSFQRILEDALAMKGFIPKYVQAVCAYDMMFRFRGSLPGLSPQQVVAYQRRIGALLKQISVEVLNKQNGYVQQRLNMFDLRSDGKLTEKWDYYDGVFSLDGARVYSFNRSKKVGHRAAGIELHSFVPEGDTVLLRGTVSAPVAGDGIVYELRVGTERHVLELQENLAPSAEYLWNGVRFNASFEARVPFKAGKKLRFVAKMEVGDSHDEFRLALRPDRWAGFAGTPRSGYFRRDGDTVYRLDDDGQLRKLKARTKFSQLGADAGFMKRLHGSGASLQLIGRRLSAVRIRRSATDRIWLLCDHKLEAGDNAEAVFRYLCAHPETGIKPVMVLAKTAPQYAELSALGEVVEPDSAAFYRRYFAAEATLNSAADDFMINPLGKDLPHFGDLIPPVSVFLQHGVTKDDQSKWLNWPSKGFDVFVTSAAREQNSLLEGAYGYQTDQVALSGLSRFDRLESRPEKLVVIAPTWRKFLVGELDKDSGRNASHPQFTESEYFKRWQALLVDETFNSVLKSVGARAVFALHPSHAAEVDKFRGTDVVSVAEYPHDYRDLFARGELLITDYSSVPFDFAYLRKPVAYLQPDREEFFGGHLYQRGYFDYGTDGFGPVVDSVSELVDFAASSLQRGPDMMPEYRARADDFFAFEGGGNCHRLVDAVNAAVHLKLGK